MPTRLATIIAIIVLLAGCAAESPTTDELKNILQTIAETAIKVRDQEISATYAGRVAMRFADMPSTDEVHVKNVKIVKTKSARDNNVIVTTSYDLQVRDATNALMMTLLLVKHGDKWVVMATQ